MATPPPEPPATPPEPTAPPPSAPPPKKGLSTGAKVAIGCGALVVVVLIVVVVAMIAGGMFLESKAGEFAGGLEAQAEATETVRRLESEHPFTPPADGVVDRDRADRFLDVTDAAWDRVEDRIEDLAERTEEIEERGGRAGLGDVTAGLQGVGGARVALAEALEARDSSVSEYLWTGIVLRRAYESLDATGDAGVPEANRELAASMRDRLAEVYDDESRKGFILGMAWTMGAGETGVRDALGLDTLEVPTGP